DANALTALAALSNVTSITEDKPRAPSLAESTALIGATRAWASGYAGANQVVAILDTGVDKTHPFLSGKIVSEACYSTTDAYFASSSVCPGGVSESIAADSGVNCDLTIDGCDHGTHVAGIAAGKDPGGLGFSGVARDANLIAVQIFSRFDSATYCGWNTPCALSWDTDIIKGLERVYALSGTYNIAAANLSLGGETYTSQAVCDAAYPAYKNAIDNLRSAGIATVIAAGNDYSSNSIEAPGCISSAISVGSTLDGGFGATPVDAVSSFSNSASFLNLLAPGQYIVSSVPGGGYSNWGGTSMATPHVTGAWAVLKSRTPAATVDQILSALTSTGVPVTDTRNGITKPRIRINAALGLFDYYFPFISNSAPSP
ncbi:MAG: S8 family serine peptidase, partial [Anaerolineales bacterium]|nr:S8 family serine peptidase [Anaerolineales bacterium]